MPHYDQQKANQRHRLRQERIKGIRNEMTDILNDYWERCPKSSSEERDLELKIELRLLMVHRQMEAFVREFRYLFNG